MPNKWWVPADSCCNRVVLSGILNSQKASKLKMNCMEDVWDLVFQVLRVPNKEFSTSVDYKCPGGCEWGSDWYGTFTFIYDDPQLISWKFTPITKIGELVLDDDFFVLNSGRLYAEDWILRDGHQICNDDPVLRQALGQCADPDLSLANPLVVLAIASAYLADRAFDLPGPTYTPGTTVPLPYKLSVIIRRYHKTADVKILKLAKNERSLEFCGSVVDLRAEVKRFIAIMQ
jgi:hypothetical protein